MLVRVKPLWCDLIQGQSHASSLNAHFVQGQIEKYSLARSRTHSDITRRIHIEIGQRPLGARPVCLAFCVSVCVEPSLIIIVVVTY